jgi:predicted dehydrogenase
MIERRFLVIGCGSIGTRHARNLLTIGQTDIVAYDTSPERRKRINHELEVVTVDDLAAGWAMSPEVAVITTPTNSHLVLALEAARRGCHLLVEKPLSDTLDGIDELAAAVTEAGVVSLVGCNLRFHPGIRALKKLVQENALGKILSAHFEVGQYLPEWRPSVDYRSSYSAQSKLGGGIILDAIHELDYAMWLLGEVSEVACFAEHISALEIDTEDVASLLLRFASGALAEVHLDYVQRAYSRTCKLVGERGTARWDYNAPHLEVYLADEGEWKTSRLFDAWDPNTMYLDELRHFVRCLDGEEQPSADVSAGARSLALALAAKLASAERRVVSPATVSVASP